MLCVSRTHSEEGIMLFGLAVFQYGFSIEVLFTRLSIIYNSDDIALVITVGIGPLNMNLSLDAMGSLFGKMANR